MAPHSGTLAWKILWTEEPGRLQSMGSLRGTTERLHFHLVLLTSGLITLISVFFLLKFWKKFLKLSPDELNLFL